MTLADFNQRVMRPATLQYVADGRVDGVLSRNRELWLALFEDDPEMLQAIKARWSIMDQHNDTTRAVIQRSDGSTG